MTSGLDTLLEAARYIELQEQQSLAASAAINISDVSLSATIGSGLGRYHHHHYNNNNNSNNINIVNNNSGNNGIIIAAVTTAAIATANNNRSNSRFNQLSSPPNSPIYNISSSSPSSSSSSTPGRMMISSSSNAGSISAATINSTSLMDASDSSNNRGSNSNRAIIGGTGSGVISVAASSKSNNSSSHHHIVDVTTAGHHSFPEFNSSLPITVTGRNSETRNAAENHSNGLIEDSLSQSNMNCINITSSGSLLSLQQPQQVVQSSSSFVVGATSGDSNATLHVGTGGSSFSMNNSDHHMVPVQQQQVMGSGVSNGIGGNGGPTVTANSRRRTTSTNSNGAGTREVHNKLEKHRRAHLKECFEQLKIQLQLKDEEKKKTSNLAILGAAYRHVLSLRRKEKELEQQVEQLAKDKINAQKKILNLKRELSAKYDNIDFSSIITDGDLTSIPGGEKVSDSIHDSVSLSSSRGSIRYSSSSSLSSGTVSSPIGSGIHSTIPAASMSPVIPTIQSSLHTPVAIAISANNNNNSNINNHQHHQLKSSSPNVTNSMPLSLTTKLSNSSSILQRISPTLSMPSLSFSSSAVSSSSSITSSPPITGGNNISNSMISIPITNNIGHSIQNNQNSTIGLKIPHIPNGIKLNSSLSSAGNNSNSFVVSSINNAIGKIANGSGIVGGPSSVVTASSSIVTITTTENENLSCLSGSTNIQIQPATIVNSTSAPININSSQQQVVQISQVPKDLSGKNGICKKGIFHESIRDSPSLSTSSLSSVSSAALSTSSPTLSASPSLSSSSSSPLSSSSPTTSAAIAAAGVILTSNTLGCAKDIKVEKIFDESEQPPKVIKLFNGTPLASMDKDNKILTSTPLVVGSEGLVVNPFSMLSSSGLRVIGPNGLATIELSTPAVQSQSRQNHQHQHSQHQQNSSQCSTGNVTVTTSSFGGPQLHKLLVTGSNAGGATSGSAGICGATTTTIGTAAVTSELARLPGGAELNILPAGTNGTTAAIYRSNGKLAIVNNGITLKGASDTSNTSGRAVHVVAPLQSNGSSISGLTPIVVSQGQNGSGSLTHFIASSPQLAGKVNLSVGGQQLPLISTQYLKPVVIMASNSTPSLTTVSQTSTAAAAAVATGGTMNSNIS